MHGYQGNGYAHFTPILLLYMYQVIFLYVGLVQCDKININMLILWFLMCKVCCL